MKASRAQGRMLAAMEELAAAYTALAEEMDEMKAALTELAAQRAEAAEPKPAAKKAGA